MNASTGFTLQVVWNYIDLIIDCKQISTNSFFYQFEQLDEIRVDDVSL